MNLRQTQLYQNFIEQIKYNQKISLGLRRPPKTAKERQMEVTHE